MKIIASLVALVVAGLLIFSIDDLPQWGDPYSPANHHVAKYYLEHSLEDSNVPNVVTSVLADYRAFDTMFETAVVFIAAMAILLIMRRDPKSKKGRKKSKGDTVIIRVATRCMVPFMQLFALYVVAHGHHSPGGGFQGGVILGASLILIAMAFGLSQGFERLQERSTVVAMTIGVLIFVGIGAGSLLLGGNFLDYSVWHVLLPATDEVMARSHGMLGVEIGVALAVMCGMFLIYASLSSDGEMEEGL